MYECSCCHSTLQLVTRVTKAALIKQHDETLAVQKQLHSPGRRVQQAFAN